MRLPVSSQTGLQQLPAPTFPQLGGISSFRGGANSPLSCTHFPSICNSHKKLNRRLSLLVLWSLSRLLPVFVFYNLQSKTRENFLNFHSSPTVLVSFYYEKNQKLKIQPNNPLNRELSCRFCFVCILFKNVWPARLLSMGLPKQDCWSGLSLFWPTNGTQGSCTSRRILLPPT